MLLFSFDLVINFSFDCRWASQPTHPPRPPPSVIVIIPTTLSSARPSSRTPPPPTSPPPPPPTPSPSQPTPRQPTLPPLIPSRTSAARRTWTRPSMSRCTRRARTRRRPSRTCTAHRWPRTHQAGQLDKELPPMRIGSRYCLYCHIAHLDPLQTVLRKYPKYSTGPDHTSSGATSVVSFTINMIKSTMRMPNLTRSWKLLEKL